jgi:putative ABC transport system substrate-binding protein
MIGMSGLYGDISRAEWARPVVIGALSESWGPTSGIVGLRDGLVQLGYREHADFYLGVRFTRGDRAALPEAARELVEAGAHLLFADSNSTARVMQHASAQIPIVFAAVEDPVGSGLVKSFAEPGAPITGVATLDTKLGPKRLQVFYELVPDLKRVLFLYDRRDVYAAAAAALYQEAGRELGLEVVVQEVSTEAQARVVLSQVKARGIGGILAPRCCALNIAGLVLEAGSRQRIPTMYTTKAFWMEAGALASFGSDFYASGVQAARLVDKIVQGAHPARIPVEVNSTVEFAINLKTAKALGLVIAPEVLYQADHIFR